MKASELRPGMAAVVDGKLCICFQSVHVTPGNLRAFMQVKLRCVADGTMIEKRLRTGEDVEGAYLDKREMEYLYSDNMGHVLMDIHTYDQITLSAEMIGDAIKFFKPNTNLMTLIHEGKVVSIDLPKSVDLLVVDTPPVPRGATATNQQKEAILETGLKVRVPPFIENGEMVRINTEDSSYVSRVKE